MSAHINVGGYITLPLSQLVKGVACVVIHHYSQYVLSQGISQHVLFKLFSHSGGYVSVGLFLFLSGYGLMESEQKHHLTAKDFLAHRLWRVYKPYLLVNFLFVLLCFGLNFYQDNWTWLFLEDIIGLSGNRVLWFVRVIMILYAYFFIMTFIPKRLNQALFIIVVSILHMVVGAMFFGQSFQVISIPAFPLGVCASLYKGEFSKAFYGWKSLIITLVLCVVLLNVAILIFGSNGLHGAINIIFIAVLLLFCSNFSWSYSYRSILGKISYEVYLTHTRIMLLWTAIYGYMMPLSVLLVVSIVMAYIINKLSR